jgi:hypothetical protein
VPTAGLAMYVELGFVRSGKVRVGYGNLWCLHFDVDNLNFDILSFVNSADLAHICLTTTIRIDQGVLQSPKNPSTRRTNPPNVDFY